MSVNSSKKTNPMTTRVTNGNTLKAFSRRVLWLVNKHKYSFVKKHAGRSTGWWGHVVARKWKMIKPTQWDIAQIELLYSVEKNRETVDAEVGADYKKAMLLIDEGVALLRKHSRRHENGQRKYRPKRKR